MPPADTPDQPAVPLDLDALEKTFSGCLLNPLHVTPDGFRTILRLIAEVRELRDELKLWKPMTIEEAEKAFAEAEAAPLSEEEIERIVERAINPAERITNSEQAQLAVALAESQGECRKLRRLLKANYCCTKADDGSYIFPAWDDARIDAAVKEMHDNAE